MRAKDSCPSCGAPVEPTDLLCANCELILDPSRIPDQPTNQELSVVRRMLEVPQPGLPSARPQRSPTATKPAEGPTRVFALGRTTGVPVVVASLTKKALALSELEAFVTSFIDGEHDVDALAERAGLTGFELGVVLQALHDKMIVDFADEPLARTVGPADTDDGDEPQTEQMRRVGPATERIEPVKLIRLENVVSLAANEPPQTSSLPPEPRSSPKLGASLPPEPRSSPKLGAGAATPPEPTPDRGGALATVMSPAHQAGEPQTSPAWPAAEPPTDPRVSSQRGAPTVKLEAPGRRAPPTERITLPTPTPPPLDPLPPPVDELESVPTPRPRPAPPVASPPRAEPNPRAAPPTERLPPPPEPSTSARGPETERLAAPARRRITSERPAPSTQSVAPRSTPPEPATETQATTTAEPSAEAPRARRTLPQGRSTGSRPAPPLRRDTPPPQAPAKPDSLPSIVVADPILASAATTDLDPSSLPEGKRPTAPDLTPTTSTTDRELAAVALAAVGPTGTARELPEVRRGPAETLVDEDATPLADSRISNTDKTPRKVLDALKQVKRAKPGDGPAPGSTAANEALTVADRSAASALQVALRMEQQGRFDEAVKYLETSIARSPDAPTLYNRLAIILMRERADLARAERLLQKALELAPSHEVYQRNLKTVVAKRAMAKR